ncbi:MAG TPA: hypothetical protein VLV83_08295 [Acidobacteriota bacterium]|nr:hypothetical protein [Acidobacteriota bacterium]
MIRKAYFPSILLMLVLGWAAPLQAQEADLVLTKDTIPPEITSMLAGGLIQYRVEITNNGPSPATDVTLVDEVAQIFVSQNVSPGASCTQMPLGVGFAREVTCTWNGPTAVGETRFVEFTARACGGSSCNSFLVADAARASSATFDPNNSNNRQTGVMGGMVPAVETEIFTQSEWELDVGADTASVRANDQVTYTITFDNLGPSSTEVTVTHALPSGWTVNDIDLPGAIQDPGDVCMGIGTETAICTFPIQGPFICAAFSSPDAMVVVADVPPLFVPGQVRAVTSIESSNCLEDLGETEVNTLATQLGPFDVHFAQFGGGEGFSSDIVLTNPALFDSVSGVLSFFGPNGDPLEIDFVDDNVMGPVSSHEFTLPPQGGLRLRTQSDGPLAIGSASVNASNEVGGVIRFRIPGVGIAGVGSSPLVHGAIAPVRQQEGVRTGLAIRSLLAEGNSVVTLSLRGFDGVEVPGGVAAIALQSNARTSRFIDELFQSADLTDFEGVVVLESGAPFTATALELGDDPGEFTTLPVTPVVTMVVLKSK